MCKLINRCRYIKNKKKKKETVKISEMEEMKKILVD